MRNVRDKSLSDIPTERLQLWLKLLDKTSPIDSEIADARSIMKSYINAELKKRQQAEEEPLPWDA